MRNVRLDMLRDWSSIPADILLLIAKNFHSIEDYVRFGAVCRSWNSAATSLKTECDGGVGGGGSRLCNSLNFSPLLILAEKNEDGDLCGFYSFSSKKVFEIDLPEIRGRRCWGSPFGWLFTVGVDMKIHLFNPFTRARISLPQMEDYIRKAILSSSPSSSDCIVMAIYSKFGKLGFLKVGDHFWSPIETGNERLDDTSMEMEMVHDVTYFNGSFFVAKASGELLICDMSAASHPEAVLFATLPYIFSCVPARKYLVDLGGELCMVLRRTVSGIPSQTYHFSIYKLDMRTRNWKQIRSLGEWSLFVGNNYTFSIRASNNPGIRSNHIYFSDDFFYFYEECRSSDAGIFTNDDKNKYISYIDRLPKALDLLSTFCPSLWFKPQF